MRFRRDHIMLN